MKSYVINLPRATHRRDSIQTEFEKFDIEFDFYSGVDWQNLSDEDILQHVDPKYIAKSKKFYRPIIHGLLACWLSHRSVWKQALQNGEDIVAIFEDDATLTVDTKAALNLLEDLNRELIDIVFLYNGKPLKPLVPVYDINDTFRLNLVKYNSIGAVGYVITRKAMVTLLEKFPLMNIHIDALMHWYWWSDLRTYILTPQVVFHGEQDTHHHSYSSEASSDELLDHLGKMKSSKVEREVRQFCDKLFSKYVPQRFAFRKRVRYESESFGQCTKFTSHPTE